MDSCANIVDVRSYLLLCARMCGTMKHARLSYLRKNDDLELDLICLINFFLSSQLTKKKQRYQEELPKKIRSRGKDAHLTHDELVQCMKWKMTVNNNNYISHKTLMNLEKKKERNKTILVTLVKVNGPTKNQIHSQCGQ